MNDELFYVGIQEPTELRKEALHSCRKILDSLKRYETYQKLSAMKTEHVLDFKRVFDELLVLNKKLKNKLPQQEIKDMPVQITDQYHEHKKHHHKHHAQIDLLERELSKVEEKLKGLE